MRRRYGPMWDPTRTSKSDTPAPDPKTPWGLTYNDRLLLRRLLIAVKDEPWPVEAHDDEEDGA